MAVMRSRDGRETWVDVGIIKTSPPDEVCVHTPTCGVCHGEVRLVGVYGGATASVRCTKCGTMYVMQKEACNAS